MDVHENSFQPADVKPILEIDLLWMTAGLGCDGDTISITAATLPSIEEIVLGALPGIPKVNFHNPVLAYENGDEFVQIFHRAAEGRSNPYILVLEGSVPDENNKAEGYWACFGTDKATGQPITTNSWLDRLVPQKPGPWWRRGLAPRMAEFMRWPEIQPARWACPIISAGNGNRRREFRSSVSRVVQFSQTTSWRCCITCFGRRRATRP